MRQPITSTKKIVASGATAFIALTYITGTFEMDNELSRNIALTTLAAASTCFGLGVDRACDLSTTFFQRIKNKFGKNQAENSVSATPKTTL